jgi:hypothetical protein
MEERLEAMLDRMSIPGPLEQQRQRTINDLLHRRHRGRQPQTVPAIQRLAVDVAHRHILRHAQPKLL